MTTRVLNNLPAEYDTLVLADPNSLLYVSADWIEFLSSFLRCPIRLLVAEIDGTLVGALPLLIKDGPAGPVANSLPFYGSNGACVIDPSRADAVSIRSALMTALSELSSSEKWRASTLITSPFEEANEFYTSCGAAFVDSRIGQITPLPTPSPDLPEALLDIFHSKTRNMVRKAQKNGYGIDRGVNAAGIDFLFDTHVENMTAIGGLAKPREFFDRLVAELPSERVQLYIARKGVEPIAAMLLLYWNRTVEYFTPVIKAEHRHDQPLSALIYEAMQDAVRAGYTAWNWGGTWLSQEGVYRFKARWGAIDRPYHYYTFTHNDPDPLIALGRSGLLREYSYFFTLPFDRLPLPG